MSLEIEKDYYQMLRVELGLKQILTIREEEEGQKDYFIPMMD